MSMRFWLAYAAVSLVAVIAGIVTKSPIVAAGVGGILVFVLVWRRIEQDTRESGHEQ
jgi:hypothetical protein